MKTVDEIYQEMVQTYSDCTGMALAPGCDGAARLYAAAAQVYALYVQGEWVARQAFPQTAEEACLDRHAALRGLERKGGARARGVVRFARAEASTQPRTIPKGTVCMTAGLVRFETAEDALLPEGAQYVDVPAQAVEVGDAGNVAAGTVTAMAVAPVGVASCTNPAAFSGGEDGEDDESLRARVLATFKRLPNGANAAYYQQEALSFGQVAQAAVIPRPRGVGTVDVVVSAPEGLPDQALLDELTDHFEQRREIAVEVQVLRAKLGDLIYRCAGVENYVISAPAADVAVEADQLPVLGELTVGELA